MEESWGQGGVRIYLTGMLAPQVLEVLLRAQDRSFFTGSEEMLHHRRMAHSNRARQGARRASAEARGQLCDPQRPSSLSQRQQEEDETDSIPLKPARPTRPRSMKSMYIHPTPSFPTQPPPQPLGRNLPSRPWHPGPLHTAASHAVPEGLGVHRLAGGQKLTGSRSSDLLARRLNFNRIQLTPVVASDH